MTYEWAKSYPDLYKKCKLYGLYEFDIPLKFQYKSLTGFIQEGPQCGLVALAICAGNPTKNFIDEIYNFAKTQKFTNNGEIFSINYMFELAKKYLNNKVDTYEGSLDKDIIREHIFKGNLLLVPYDCDLNHAPCKKLGHKSHWAVIHGGIETDEGVYVIAKHGKSLNLSIWSLKDLSESNDQLVQFSPDREKSDLLYILPLGGLNGPNGLKNKAIIIVT